MEENKNLENNECLPAVTSEELNETATALEKLCEKEEKAADTIVSQLDIKEEDYPKIKRTVHEFVSDYAHKDSETTDKQFLVKKFSGYSKLFKDAEEIEKKANGNLTQEFINSQLKQMRMEHLKREGEK